MKRLIIASLGMVVGLTACTRAGRMDSQSGAVTISGELFALLLVGVVLYMILSNVIGGLSRWKPWAEGDSFDLVSRRAVRHRPPARRHRGRHLGRGQVSDHGLGPGASASDSVPHPPTP